MYHVLAHRPGRPADRRAERFAAKVAKAVRGAAAEAARRGMINLDFFPSRRLAFYMVRLFLTRSLAVLVALVLVLMTLDLLGESGKILAVPGNGDAELWHYVSLRIPLLVSRFLPFSVLLGTLIAFVGAQPAQRSRGDEGRGPFGAPDPRAADPRQHRHRRCCCSPSTRRWWSSRRRVVTAWSRQ